MMLAGLKSGLSNLVHLVMTMLRELVQIVVVIAMSLVTLMATYLITAAQGIMMLL